jgi:hypothetical protein
MGAWFCVAARYELKEKINQIFNIYIKDPTCPPWIGHFMIFWNEAFKLLDKNINSNIGFEFSVFLSSWALLDSADERLLDLYNDDQLLDPNNDNQLLKFNNDQPLDQFFIQNDVLDDLENDIENIVNTKSNYDNTYMPDNTINSTNLSLYSYDEHRNEGKDDILQKNNLFIRRLKAYRNLMLKLDSVTPAIPLLDKMIDIYNMTDPDKNFLTSISDDSRQALLKLIEDMNNVPKCKNPKCDKKVVWNDYQNKYFDYCSSECLPQNIKENVSKCANPECNNFSYYCMKTDTYPEYCSVLCNLKTMMKKNNTHNPGINILLSVKESVKQESIQ